MINTDTTYNELICIPSHSIACNQIVNTNRRNSIYNWFSYIYIYVFITNMNMSSPVLRVGFVGAGAVNFGGPEGPWDHATRLEKIGGVEVRSYWHIQCCRTLQKMDVPKMAGNMSITLKMKLFLKGPAANAVLILYKETDEEDMYYV